MKKLVLISLVALLIMGCSVSSLTSTNNDNKESINSAINEDKKNKEYINSIGDTLFYIHKLKDEDFISTYGGEHLYTWYTAAEELGQIGKSAIPYLMKNLDTKNDYERALTLYALLLASQHENVKILSDGKYINVPLDFDSSTHDDYVEIAKTWWEKYKHNWE